MQLPFLGTNQYKTLFTPESHIHINFPDLKQFIPENSMEYILDWFKVHPVQLRLSDYRVSKSGDYRAPMNNFPARISVNSNLNRFDFLITLVHEMAHHEVWSEISALDFSFKSQPKKNRPSPHGKEWKACYRQLMKPLMNESVFPAGVLHYMISYFENPLSSSKSDRNLVIELKKYDAPDGYVFIESLGPDALFTLPAGRKFRKQGRLRKRYRCLCLDNGRIYLFSPAVRVFPLQFDNSR
jgi:hypothetical protein